MTPSSNNMETGSSRLKVPLGILAAVNLVFFGPFLFRADPVTVGTRLGDLLLRFRPIREFAATQTLQGHFPFWNPYNYSGHPFAADPETALFYPFTYLFALLPIHLAFSWNYFLHYLIAGTGVFLYCKQMGRSHPASLTAAFVFEFSAPTLLRIYGGHLTPISSMAWIPWSLWALERFFSRPTWKNSGAFGLVLVMNFLSGYALFTYINGWLLLAHGAHSCITKKLVGEWDRWLPKLLCVSLLAAGAFLVQLEPTLELLENTTRKGGSIERSSSFSLGKENLITRLAPKYVGENYAGEDGPVFYFGRAFVWENSCFMGTVALTLFLVAVRDWGNRATRFWSIVAAAALVISLGTQTPIFAICYKVLPGFHLFRGYAKLLVFACLAMAILAANGLDLLASPSAQNWNRRVSCILPAALAALGIWSLASPDTLPFWKKQMEETYAAWAMTLNPKKIEAHLHFMQASLVWTFGFASLISALCWTLCRSPFLQKNHKALACALALAEFFVYAKPYFSPLNAETQSVPGAFYRPILAEPVWTRVFHLEWPVANVMFPAGVSSVGGYEPFVLREYKNLANIFAHYPVDQYMAINPSKEIMDFLAAEYIMGPILLSASFPLDLAVSEDVDGQPHRLYRRKGTFSRYHIAHAAKPIPAASSTAPHEYKSLVAEMTLGYPATAYVSADRYKSLFMEGPIAAEIPGAKEEVRAVSEEINRVVLTARLESPGILTVSDNYFPGWRARVDGEPGEVFPVNLIMKGVRLPAGTHRVELYFIPTRFFLYGGISLLSLLILLGITFAGTMGRGKPASLPRKLFFF